MAYYYPIWLPLVLVIGCSFICQLFHATAQSQISSVVYPNSTNCLENDQDTILQSQNGRFALKYSKLSNQNQYLVIAYIQYNEIIVWTSNRDRPIKGKPCLKLGNQADLILLDPNGSVAWSANVSQVDHLELQDSGNFILQNNKNDTLWASFDHLTDTIIQGGYLGSGKALISNRSSDDLSRGPYMLKMEPGGVVFYASFPSPLPYGVWTYDPTGFGSSSFVKIAMHSSCNNTLLRYESRGQFISLEQEDGTMTTQCKQETQGRSSSARQIVNAYPIGDDLFRFLRLDGDGNVRTYIQSKSQLIYDLDMFSIYFQDICKLPNICGSLGICGSGGNCNCFDDVAFKEFQSNVGCIPRKNPICRASNQFVKLEGVDYFANGYTNPGSSSLEQCKQSCLSNCSCTAAFFWNNTQACYHYQEVKSLQRVSDQSILAFIKVGPGSFKENDHKSKRNPIVLAASVGGACFIVTVFSLLGFLVWRYKGKKPIKSKSEEDEFLENLPGLPPRFSYKEMEEATDGFSRQLGAGAFGAVFEGELQDGRKVAVKKLGSADQGHLQFRAEVATLGSINHVNLVRLFGFCADGTHRLLVYEYMSNVSLDRWLFQRPLDNSSSLLDWRHRYKIIHDTARGLAFLHERSRDRILHLDVKPQNILLDENFGAKLADFGLAKLMDRSQSRAYTRIRGTPGYLAPEWLLHASATDRSDVYSFGMVLLEIISGRKNFDLSLPEDMQFFPCWAIKMIEEGKIMEVVDPKLGLLASEECEQTERVIKIAFWCIQEGERKRPSMNQVILMLEGHMEVENPPLSMPYLSRTRGRISAYLSELQDPSKEPISNNAATFSMSLSGR
ncbi:hypothetical protein KI387_043984 [Taxus chinensis]|uniref:Receptor-like serine/threonine-protein kinase n=1 Tax=Taxus chinensis TaxID=29808 RepID=A0AA38LAF6_TAXCH|nr:hypothetical protein KI387_043984 [Taxus chinensis]